MALYSSTYLKGLSKNKTISDGMRILSESKNEHTSFDIFLSHSFLDKDEVEGLYLELTKMGFKVYVDWIIDPHLDRANVTQKTATIVRDRLRSSKTLLLAVSMNASLSKWMPWELGYVDGHTNKCAIIPISKDTNPPKSYKGVEYLSLYPFISKVPMSNTKIEKLWVVEEASIYIILDDWLVGKSPFQRITNIF